VYTCAIREWATWVWGGCWCECYSAIRYIIVNRSHRICSLWLLVDKDDLINYQLLIIYGLLLRIFRNLRTTMRMGRGEELLTHGQEQNGAIHWYLQKFWNTHAHTLPTHSLTHQYIFTFLCVSRTNTLETLLNLLPHTWTYLTNYQTCW
jgi:hypothetical protein